jgi:hypothetical protein
MATTPDSLSTSVPLIAALELGEYEQFAPCDVPRGSGAIRAFKGYIRPFSNDENARQVLRAIEANLPLNVWGGRLFAEAAQMGKHPLEGYLVAMALPCTILVLEFPGKEHPRAFLLEPAMTQRLSMPSHLRTDKRVEINGRMLPALCVYSGSLFRYGVERSILAQFLDQTATYLAKYIIWLRTRQLYEFAGVGRRLVAERGPEEPVTEPVLSRARNLAWDGYWPGPSAPSGPVAHLATIRPEDECWCWSGSVYGRCCRPRELADVLVPKLMNAVYSKMAERPATHSAVNR